MKFAKVCRIISKNEVVIQKGERAGEVVYRLGVSDADGDGALVDIPAKISSETFNAIELFSKEYRTIFEYSVKAFNGRSYTDFSVIGIGHVSPPVAPAEEKSAPAEEKSAPTEEKPTPVGKK